MKIDVYGLGCGAYKLIKNSKTGKIRYHAVYKKVTEYVESRYENACLSDLMKTKNGWSCIANSGTKSVVVYITENADGEYNIWEKEIK